MIILARLTVVSVFRFTD